MQTETNQPGRFLRLPDVTAQVGLKKSAIYDKVKKGEFPAPVKLNGWNNCWIESEIESWKAQKIDSRDKPEEQKQ